MMDAIVSFIIAVIVGLGIGGGGFFVIYLTLCMNYGQIIAQGTNLLFFLVSGISALFIHIRRKSVFSPELLFIIATTLPATALGAHIADFTDPKIPTFFLGALLVISGIISGIRTVKAFIKEKNEKN
ncbi:MAG: sulfite exporter TauE/SafE family protein [Clostridia bacterium]|nr:sulfite exporter TauE/SafE family protein [Clostridia bacterium]